MSDQAYINSLYRSASNYNSQASYWRGQASAAQSTIDALNPQLAHKREQLGYANDVNGMFPGLTSAVQTLDAQLEAVATGLAALRRRGPLRRDQARRHLRGSRQLREVRLHHAHRHARAGDREPGAADRGRHEPAEHGQRERLVRLGERVVVLQQDRGPELAGA